MTSAKDIVIKPITRKAADRVIKRGHYSGKVVMNSQLHLGVFMSDRLKGALQFGPPLDRGKMLHLVRGAEWESVLELNRMFLSDDLPRNGESRSIAVACKMLRKHAPQVKWVVSFSDATQCGDGTIYRAAGFVLTAIKKSANLARLPDGTVVHKMTLESNPTAARAELGGRSYYDITGGRYNFKQYLAAARGTVLPGFQFRYVRFLDPDYRRRLTVAEIPFSDIPAEARMVRGIRPT